MHLVSDQSGADPTKARSTEGAKETEVPYTGVAGKFNNAGALTWPEVGQRVNQLLTLDGAGNGSRNSNNNNANNGTSQGSSVVNDSKPDTQRIAAHVGGRILIKQYVIENGDTTKATRFGSNIFFLTSQVKSRIKELLILLIGWFIFSCESSKNSIKCENTIPKIEFEVNDDTLSVGEIFQVEIWLSDTSFLFVKDAGEQTSRRVYPVFKVNGEVILNHYFDTYTVFDTADLEVVYPEFPGYREIECSIIFPHPEIGEGTIELTKLITYIVIE